MNRLILTATATAGVLVLALVGYNLLPRASGPGGQTSAPSNPSASPVPLAVGSFISHGAQIELHATGDGTNVTGSLIATDVAGDTVGKFTLDLECTRTSPGGLIEIGGVVTDATHYEDFAPKGARIAIVFQRGPSVKAFIHSEYPDPPKATCQAFLESVPDVGDPGASGALEAIEGTVELRP